MDVFNVFNNMTSTLIVSSNNIGNSDFGTIAASLLPGS